MIDNLEIGKVYYVEISSFMGFRHWLFKKDSPRYNYDVITSCRRCICLDNGYMNRGNASHVCCDDDIMVIKPANRNYIALWNKKFNDNIELI